MYKRHKREIWVIGVASLTLSFVLKLDVDTDLINSLMTVLSIVFGFNITAISTLYSRKFIINLHKIIDNEKPGQTQLQTLKNYFTISSNTTLAAIVYLVLYQLFIKKCRYVLFSFLEVELFLTSLILPLVLVNICVVVFLVKIFLKGLIYEAEVK